MLYNCNHLIVGFILTVLLIESSQSLSCPKCSQNRCPILRNKLCRAGVTRDPCLCCMVCAKGLGEVCGGESSRYGTCGAGLTCYPKMLNRRGVCIRQGTGPTIPRLTTTVPTQTRQTASTTHASRATTIGSTTSPTTIITISTATTTPTTANPSKSCPLSCSQLEYCTENPNNFCSVTRKL